jgi:F0F1-type ATP synthase assembly protein I
LTYGAAVVLYALGGWWLDGKLGTSPLFLLIGVGLGAVGGFLWVYREVLRAEAQSREKKAAEAGEREGESTSK